MTAPPATAPTRGAGWRADCPKCVGSRFTCDEHFQADRHARVERTGDGTCIRCGACPDNPATGLCATCEDDSLTTAASELLGVVLDMFENPDFQVAIGGNPNVVERLMERARATIAKAKGQQP